MENVTINGNGLNLLIGDNNHQFQDNAKNSHNNHNIFGSDVVKDTNAMKNISNFVLNQRLEHSKQNDVKFKGGKFGTKQRLKTMPKQRKQQLHQKRRQFSHRAFDVSQDRSCDNNNSNQNDKNDNNHNNLITGNDKHKIERAKTTKHSIHCKWKSKNKNRFAKINKSKTQPQAAECNDIQSSYSSISDIIIDQSPNPFVREPVNNNNGTSKAADAKHIQLKHDHRNCTSINFASNHDIDYNNDNYNGSTNTNDSNLDNINTHLNGNNQCINRKLNRCDLRGLNSLLPISSAGTAGESKERNNFNDMNT